VVLARNVRLDAFQRAGDLFFPQRADGRVHRRGSIIGVAANEEHDVSSSPESPRRFMT